MKSEAKYRDRKDAGQTLAILPAKYANRPDTLVLGLPRGGVPVAFEVASELGCELDVLVVRKLGTPGQEELAMGAIASGGFRQLNSQIIRGCGISAEDIEAETLREDAELRRREVAYREDRPPLNVKDRTVIIVDDGLATGVTMHVAIKAVRAMGAKRIIAAVPVGSVQACREITSGVDEMVCPLKPNDLVAISLWYEDFRQIGDNEVQQILGAQSTTAP